VRAPHPYDDLLEPLPVVVDGVLVEPTSEVNPLPLHEVVPRAVEAVDAMCARILEKRGLAALAPWLGPNASMTETRPPTPPTTFSRIVELDAVHLASLPGWWEQHARRERLVVGRRLSLSAPRDAAGGVWTMRAALRVRWQVLPVRMELSMWRHLGGLTKLTLAPRRRVFVKGLYFETGHRTLDILCDRLIRELAHSGRRG
jgi:hypothetical protein